MIHADDPAIEQLDRIATEFPDLLEEFIAACENGRPVPDEMAPFKHGARIQRRKPREGTAFQRVARLFLENSNEWLDTGEITIQSGVTRNVVAHILWSAHKDEFEQRPHATHKRMKLWRLKPDVADELQKQNRLFEKAGEA